MPLRDHFRPPLTERASWEEVHGGWPMVIVQQLIRILPERYVAAPRVHLGSAAEVDVSTYERVAADRDDRRATSQPSALWSPAQPTLALETELADTDEYEVRVVCRFEVARDVLEQAVVGGRLEVVRRELEVVRGERVVQPRDGGCVAAGCRAKCYRGSFHIRRRRECP